MRYTLKLLSQNGNFSIIIPYKEEKRVLGIAKELGLYPVKMTRVRGNTTSEIKRSLLLFGFEKKECMPQELIIENSRHEYTEAYVALTQDFYLKM